MTDLPEEKPRDPKCNKFTGVRLFGHSLRHAADIAEIEQAKFVAYQQAILDAIEAAEEGPTPP